MKKVYSLAACVAIAASAIAAPVQKQVSVNDATSAALVEMATEVSGMRMTPAKAPAKAIKSAADLMGIYKCYYQWGLTNTDPYGGMLQPTFEPGATANEIIIKGMPYSDVDIIAYFDASAMTLTINKQFVGILGTGENQLSASWLCQVVNEAEKKWEFTSKIEGKVGADGTIDFENKRILLGQENVGYYCAFGHMYYENVPYVKVDLGNYHLQGNAKFKDDALCHFFKEEYRPGAVDVPCYLSADGSTVVLDNPYMCGAWAQLNGQTANSALAKGYISINIEDPEVALLSPMLGAGMWLDDADEGEPSMWVDFYPYNEEGFMVSIEDYDTNDVYNEFAAVGRELSAYDEDTNTITIRNMWFGETGNPLGRYGFAAEKNPDGTVKEWVKISYTIELPDGFGAVNSIADDNNVAPRYFNLQGLEVTNPAAGELVIVKKGGKTSKTIVR
ncbi:MAG: hypothetical protein K2M87_07115 [Muribaculaceae bacterium]|nr:hypothetical protein [Muribaculaceae bacterium]